MGTFQHRCCHSVPTFDSNNPLGAVFISALRNMAYHRKLVLPAFKVTRRSTAGDILEKDVPRGLKNRDEPVYSEDTAELSSEEEDSHCVDFNSESWTTEFSPGPELYEISQKASVSAWKSIRQGALKAVTETNTIPKNQICIFCRPYLDVCGMVTVSTFCVSRLPICRSRIV